MIRLNDEYNTRLNEKDISYYCSYENDEDFYKIIMFINSYNHVLFYKTEEARDKDIELLDKLFEVKDIKDVVECQDKIYPTSTDSLSTKSLLNSAITAIKQECSDTKTTNIIEIKHPFFMGGPKKCSCYEKIMDVSDKKFTYPTKNREEK